MMADAILCGASADRNANEFGAAGEIEAVTC